jgi:nuclear GTP-binding protein
LDSPGVVLSTKEQSDSLILRQAVKVEELVDVMRPVEAIVARIEREELCKLYQIERFNQIEELLGHIARTKGFLKTGGIPNFDQAARKVIRDYLDGKIAYFTPAPHGITLDDDDLEMDNEITQ